MVIGRSPTERRLSICFAAIRVNVPRKFKPDENEWQLFEFRYSLFEPIADGIGT